MIVNLFGFVIFTTGRFVLPSLALCFRMFSVAVLDHELNRSNNAKQFHYIYRSTATRREVLQPPYDT